MRNLLHLIIVMLTVIFLPMTGNAAAAPADIKPVNFLVVTDIHFNPFASCSTSPCPLIEKLRKAPVSGWAQIFSLNSIAMPTFGQDSSYPLLVSALAAARQTAHDRHALFALMPGDFLGHEYRKYYLRYSTDKYLSGYRDFVRKTMEFLTMQIRQAFPDIDVYPAVGNNDSYQDDYYSDPEGAFFHDTAGSWATLIKNKSNSADMRREFPAGGYYSVNLPDPVNARLIVLNTNLFSHKARGRGIDTAARMELDWLHQQLQAAREKRQRVLITMHIPEGVDVYATLKIRLFTIIQLWKAEYLQRFRRELQTYAPEIAGILAGHLHSDWFQILAFNQRDQFPVSGTPAVSPIYGNNPGFKIYSWSPQEKQIVDYVTFYYPLSAGKAWGMEYDFNRIYRSSEHCQDCPVTPAMSSITPQGSLADSYRLFYAVSTQNQPITTKWYPYYWCAIWNIEPQPYKKCIEN